MIRTVRSFAFVVLGALALGYLASANLPSSFTVPVHISGTEQIVDQANAQIAKALVFVKPYAQLVVIYGDTVRAKIDSVPLSKADVVVYGFSAFFALYVLGFIASVVKGWNSFWLKRIIRKEILKATAEMQRPVLQVVPAGTLTKTVRREMNRSIQEGHDKFGAPTGSSVIAKAVTN